MGDDRFVLVVAGLTFIGLFILLGWVAIEEEKRWRVFAEQHSCKVVGKKESQSLTTVTFTDGKTGVGSTYIPPQVGYACDDGVTYWRNQ